MTTLNPERCRELIAMGFQSISVTETYLVELIEQLEAALAEIERLRSFEIEKLQKLLADSRLETIEMRRIASLLRAELDARESDDPIPSAPGNCFE